MSLYRVWYIRHTMSASERDKWLKHRANPEQTPAPVIRYRKKRMVKDVEGESEADAVTLVNSTPAQEGDPYTRVWAVCPATDHVTIATLDGCFLACEVPLFPEEELSKCER
jgi:hypothetical protein